MNYRRAMKKLIFMQKITVYFGNVSQIDFFPGFLSPSRKSDLKMELVIIASTLRVQRSGTTA